MMDLISIIGIILSVSSIIEEIVYRFIEGKKLRKRPVVKETIKRFIFPAWEKLKKDQEKTLEYGLNYSSIHGLKHKEKIEKIDTHTDKRDIIFRNFSNLNPELAQDIYDWNAMLGELEIELKSIYETLKEEGIAKKIEEKSKDLDNQWTSNYTKRAVSLIISDEVLNPEDLDDEYWKNKIEELELKSYREKEPIKEKIESFNKSKEKFREETQDLKQNLSDLINKYRKRYNFTEEEISPRQ